MAHEEARCQHCKRTIYRVRGFETWYHRDTRSQFCVGQAQASLDRAAGRAPAAATWGGAVA